MTGTTTRGAALATFLANGAVIRREASSSPMSRSQDSSPPAPRSSSASPAPIKAATSTSHLTSVKSTPTQQLHASSSDSHSSGNSSPETGKRPAAAQASEASAQQAFTFDTRTAYLFLEIINHIIKSPQLGNFINLDDHRAGTLSLQQLVNGKQGSALNQPQQTMRRLVERNFNAGKTTRVSKDDCESVRRLIDENSDLVCKIMAEYSREIQDPRSIYRESLGAASAQARKFSRELAQRLAPAPKPIPIPFAAPEQFAPFKRGVTKSCTEILGRFNIPAVKDNQYVNYYTALAENLDLKGKVARLDAQENNMQQIITAVEERITALNGAISDANYFSVVNAISGDVSLNSEQKTALVQAVAIYTLHKKAEANTLAVAAREQRAIDLRGAVAKARLTSVERRQAIPQLLDLLYVQLEQEKSRASAPDNEVYRKDGDKPGLSDQIDSALLEIAKAGGKNALDVFNDEVKGIPQNRKFDIVVKRLIRELNLFDSIQENLVSPLMSSQQISQEAVDAQLRIIPEENLGILKTFILHLKKIFDKPADFNSACVTIGPRIIDLTKLIEGKYKADGRGENDALRQAAALNKAVQALHTAIMTSSVLNPLPVVADTAATARPASVVAADTQQEEPVVATRRSSRGQLSDARKKDADAVSNSSRSSASSISSTASRVVNAIADGISSAWGSLTNLVRSFSPSGSPKAEQRSLVVAKSLVVHEHAEIVDSPRVPVDQPAANRTTTTAQPDCSARAARQRTSSPSPSAKSATSINAQLSPEYISTAPVFTNACQLVQVKPGSKSSNIRDLETLDSFGRGWQGNFVSWGSIAITRGDGAGGSKQEIYSAKQLERSGAIYAEIMRSYEGKVETQKGIFTWNNGQYVLTEGTRTISSFNRSQRTFVLASTDTGRFESIGNDISLVEGTSYLSEGEKETTREGHFLHQDLFENPGFHGKVTITDLGEYTSSEKTGWFAEQRTSKVPARLTYDVKNKTAIEIISQVESHDDDTPVKYALETQALTDRQNQRQQVNEWYYNNSDLFDNEGWTRLDNGDWRHEDGAIYNSRMGEIKLPQKKERTANSSPASTSSSRSVTRSPSPEITAEYSQWQKPLLETQQIEVQSREPEELLQRTGHSRHSPVSPQTAAVFASAKSAQPQGNQVTPAAPAQQQRARTSSSSSNASSLSASGQAYQLKQERARLFVSNIRLINAHLGAGVYSAAQRRLNQIFSENIKTASNFAVTSSLREIQDQPGEIALYSYFSRARSDDFDFINQYAEQLGGASISRTSSYVSQMGDRQRLSSFAESTVMSSPARREGGATTASRGLDLSGVVND